MNWLSKIKLWLVKSDVDLNDPLDKDVAIAVYPFLPPSGDSLSQLGERLKLWWASHPEIVEMVGLDSLEVNRLPPPIGAHIDINEPYSRCFIELRGTGESRLLIDSLKRNIPATLMRNASPSWGEYMM
jgi:hypothetical protein